jgi:hypothetical protein
MFSLCSVVREAKSNGEKARNIKQPSGHDERNWGYGGKDGSG